ncbi:hypothetical protein EHV15_34295 [Paenibacillus oralis]|uniref:Uncharacterized protein n=1 Tax=Paenibacillus oralis TaxID=2490856 RepID=A0A3P3T9J5_9BACL|nr:hypothetical protein [Paenibacillus oralis]RRJ54670.1 hypothetical protein EHV15_34295 [Paenibacillus oralis]
MAKLKYSKLGVVLNPESIAEAMSISECFIGVRSNPKKFSWHSLVTRSEKPLSEVPPIAEMGLWGISLDQETLEKTESILRSKRKVYRRGMLPLSAWKDTPAYKKARERVEALFGKPMKDGRVLFPYQLDLAAYIVCVKRILNAWEMGLGSAQR